MSNKETKKEIRKTGAAAAKIQAMDSIDIAGIFYMSSSSLFKSVFEEVFKFIMLPIAAFGNLAMMALDWKQAILSKYEGHAVAKAVMQTVAALAITAAVIGALAFTSVFTLVAPILFTAAIGGRALFNAGSSIYFGVKSAQADNKSDKIAYRKKAIESGVHAVAGLLVAAAVAAMMIFAKPVLAILGIAGGIFGAGFAVSKAIELSNPEVQKNKARSFVSANDDDFDSPDMSRNAAMTRTLTTERPKQKAPAAHQAPAPKSPANNNNDNNPFAAPSPASKQEQAKEEPKPTGTSPVMKK